ncbi:MULTISPECIES: Mrp/NBP35 family ATP-binding protein [Prochlorococcus]|uniref:Iron-sulfur cluster carrier protein n=1 Tax=Prochlorococcus marinus (strain SARG / CCMP1375 / SS120) TaxID=167539 RepID=Q7V9T8_PROMA|nr:MULTISPECIES: Mrp/NBP35 family ATP-binding protein [Prochlorococcus]AAQ00780.1 ATPase [Prochlorococcus marinus subsp. marinus str. CCMP1375]KGG10725.1 Scaffold protein for 4Fe-4S cluster assembly [Prochlorococcus marinus str. LG]KGG21147.1 Scaffold protein for 4Fe-4S cluster assembly [Prochlorococcus marinus str. SS2]KGG23971.1 Scaffold protein for 4Fe-4S cluster assembly [Prochlorococcus marinus str. SS35]KGG31769.1 Scaffold protein for 4Fe-4S cluster assembly [Prochlorococcus marinus str.
MLSEEELLKALSSIKDSGSNRSVVDLGWLDQLRINHPKAIVRLNLPSYAQSQRDRIAAEAKRIVESYREISELQIELSNANGQSEIGNAGHGQVSSLQKIPGVKNVIAVSSGKGGVGKSTVAVNLACGLSQKGYSVGLLDADIYGPNTPIMLGVSDKTPEVQGSGAEQKIIPIESFGISMVSMGLLIDDNQPVIWRGPMLNGIIRQFLYQASWGEKDFLVVDLPPGTGDAQLSLAQAVPMSGVLIVTTPQKVSLQDSRRGLAMFKQMNVPILGVIENMSSFIPPDQPEREYAIFGTGGGQVLSEENSVPLLAKLPLEMNTSNGNEEDKPIVFQYPDSKTAKAFERLALSVLEIIETNSN